MALDIMQRMRGLAASQGGYFYPWKSSLAPGNGEDAYAALVEACLQPDATVLEAGCGHGPDIPRFAPKVARYVAYDAVAEFIDIARRAAAERGLTNVELVVANSAPQHNGGRARLPADDGSVDLIVSRRGPTNFILDARRAVRPGGALIQLNPVDLTAPWFEALPTALPLPGAYRAAGGFETIAGRIAARLAEGGLALHSAWTFDVPEILAEPEDLYACLTWMTDDPPPLTAVRADLERLFREFAGPKGLELRHRRYLWKAVVG
ncbi:class I SAM-dependent methyltransferase [Phenylobacterium sp.]|jgi:SAM-dependent methyltransferase|uniref:class I SAM-dependent methyltransferase n=1 Tax=Phenylobacterium sp. TaxID=1871053 RepID=UPI002E303F8A|nr:class I SAM-dependent methyltransferase [Phenylobacterium sp.]HEX2561010.1 class I SAM-dependent methyltransferase [Phenylobacterium sp.]